MFFYHSRVDEDKHIDYTHPFDRPMRLGGTSNAMVLGEIARTHNTHSKNSWPKSGTHPTQPANSIQSAHTHTQTTHKIPTQIMLNIEQTTYVYNTRNATQTGHTRTLVAIFLTVTGLLLVVHTHAHTHAMKPTKRPLTMLPIN